MEVVGEYLGIDTDRGLDAYFRRRYGAWFPALRRVHRTTFVRQGRESVGDQGARVAAARAAHPA